MCVTKIHPTWVYLQVLLPVFIAEWTCDILALKHIALACVRYPRSVLHVQKSGCRLNPIQSLVPT
jgi:hypothetical protein